MTRILIISLTLTFTLSDSLSQELSEKDEKKIEKRTKKALKEWFENPSLDNEVLDPQTIEQFQDSGIIENGLKEGIWIEYSLDSSFVGQETTFIVGDKQFPMNLGPTLQKEVGNYTNGKRHGLWTLYTSHDKKAPFFWSRTTLTEYELGKKHGKDILLSFNDTILIRSFVNGQENGIGKIFNTNYPYELQEVYNAVDEQRWLLESYYPSGQLRIKYTDTIINNKELKYFNDYYENGTLKLSGYYINGEVQYGTWISYYENGETEIIKNYTNGKLNGNYKYFHSNGQLWTERIYNDGKLWNIISNFNKKGKKKDKGTIRNGTGTLNYYDEQGNLTETVEYINGLKKE